MVQPPKEGGLLYLYGSIRFSPCMLTAQRHQSVHKPSQSSQSLSVLSATLGPSFQGGLCEAFQCLNLQDKLLFLSHTFPHTNLTPTPLPISFLYFFLELIAGVPRGAQSFGYVSMKQISTSDTKDRLWCLQKKGAFLRSFTATRAADM